MTLPSCDGQLPPLIQAMLNPEFYEHEVQEPIRLIQTHISYVLLTGKYAYKVKKAIAFGFLDFSSLAKRKVCCETELRLNRRLSPELYIAVLQIGKIGHQYKLNHSPAVEYLVKMRQFPQSCLFSQRFQQQTLALDDLIDLAQQIAIFHQRADQSRDIQAYGAVDVVRSIHDNNYQLSLPYLGRTQSQQQYEETQAYTHQFFDDHHDWIGARQSYVRECHGDLHLNNVCRFQGTVQVFDCIEFNQEFRNIDTLYDVAFMVMDLEFRGRHDFAYQFLNTYLEETGDYLGARLLPIYLLMRAYIRGNVCSMALDDAAMSPGQQQDLKRQAIAYYKLAWQYTQRRCGQIYLMCGLSGSGKSTVARYLSQRHPAIYIRSDAVRKHLAGIPLDQSGVSHNIYTPQMTQRTYSRLLELGLALAQAGWTVILDAKYDRQHHRQHAIASSHAAHVDLKILHCHVESSRLKTRLIERQNDISDANADLLTQQMAQFEPFNDREKQYVVSIKTDVALGPQLQTFISTRDPRNPLG